MERYGLIDAGFNTIVLDDAWATQESDKAKLTYDPTKFPEGISGLKTALKAINRKLKIGIYSDAGSMTHGTISLGHMALRASILPCSTHGGVDMLKYDYCNSEASTKVSYTRMGRAVAALNETRKAKGEVPFVYNICEWGKTQPWTWGAAAGGSSWRSTSDAREDWIGNPSRPGVIGGVDETRRLWMYAGVNHFNDLDMMCIGLHGLGGASNNTAEHQTNGGKITGLTDAQARTQMSLWSMLAGQKADSPWPYKALPARPNASQIPSLSTRAAPVFSLISSCRTQAGSQTQNSDYRKGVRPQRAQHGDCRVAN